MSPLDIENIVVKAGAERGWNKHTMAWVFELVSDAVETEREACANLADAWGGRLDQMTDTAFIPGASADEKYASAGIADAIRNRT